MTAAVQLDLLGLAPQPQRLVDGLTCLRDVVPEALEAVVYLREWQTHTLAVASRSLDCTSGAWWYKTSRTGLHFERVGERDRSTWPLGRALAHLITWSELADLVGDDPRRADLCAWSESLTEPAWDQRIRPHELWPAPDCWHPSYIEHDHEHPGWTERLAAWTALREMCSDAITALEAA
ncbi:hypothetical protein [Actinomadura geliboluensis]|uniref:hypothetical protein n=1 Tax=Actinomadura geliboluensis TaxID=882440 RepID=UPI003678D042